MFTELSHNFLGENKRKKAGWKSYYLLNSQKVFTMLFSEQFFKEKRKGGKKPKIRGIPEFLGEKHVKNFVNKFKNPKKKF